MTLLGKAKQTCLDVHVLELPRPRTGEIDVLPENGKGWDLSARTFQHFSTRLQHWTNLLMAWLETICILETFKGTPGYRNKLILIHSQWLVSTNGATFIFIGKLGNKFLPVQFWPSLSSSALRHGPKSWFLILWTKAHASLLLWYKLCGDGVVRYGLNGSHQLLSKLRIMHLNSKIICSNSDIGQNEFLLLSTHDLSCPCFSNLGSR